MKVGQLDQNGRPRASSGLLLLSSQAGDSCSGRRLPHLGPSDNNSLGSSAFVPQVFPHSSLLRAQGPVSGLALESSDGRRLFPGCAPEMSCSRAAVHGFQATCLLLDAKSDLFVIPATILVTKKKKKKPR